MEIIRARLCNAQQAKTWLDSAYVQLKPQLLSERMFDVVIKPETRTLAQNRLMWSRLRDLADQVEPIPGKRFSKEGWKDYITAHLNGQEMVPDMHGTGFVVISKGKATSEMTKAEMVAVSDLAMAFGDEKGVAWSRTSLGRDWPEEVTA